LISSENNSGFAVPETGLASGREGYPLPSISGIIEFAGNRKLILGAQSLTGTILMSKDSSIALAQINSQNGTDALSVTASTTIARVRGCAQGQMSHVAVEKKELRGKLCASSGTAPLKPKSGLNGAPVVTWNSGAEPHLGDMGNHTIVRCAVVGRLLVCAWGWGLEDTVALKVTRKNLQRLAEAFANDAADPYKHFHRADVMAHFKMNIEEAWSEGIEVYATEDGFVFSEWGVMSEYKVAAQA
jgi:hypothetical protein